MHISISRQNFNFSKVQHSSIHSTNGAPATYLAQSAHPWELTSQCREQGTAVRTCCRRSGTNCAGWGHSARKPPRTEGRVRMEDSPSQRKRPELGLEGQHYGYQEKEVRHFRSASRGWEMWVTKLMRQPGQSAKRSQWRHNGWGGAESYTGHRWYSENLRISPVRFLSLCCFCCWGKRGI